MIRKCVVFCFSISWTEVIIVLQALIDCLFDYLINDSIAQLVFYLKIATILFIFLSNSRSSFLLCERRIVVIGLFHQHLWNCIKKK